MIENTEEPILRHEICNACYHKLLEQNPMTTTFNECTLCLFNAQALKTNNYKPLPTAKKIA